ncbi:MAG: hypothetical protein DMG11_11495, partial [Acidobacteria bacterium]
HGPAGTSQRIGSAADRRSRVRNRVAGRAFHNAREEALAGFMLGKPLASNQIEFLNLIVNHLTEHGVMEASLLYESPFTDLTPQGPDGLFSSTQVDELLAVLEGIKATAIAA